MKKEKMWRFLGVILFCGCLCGTLADLQREDEDIPKDHGNSIETDKIGLPIYTTLNGSVTNLNEINSKITLNRTQAFLNCSQGSMQVELMFQEPFYGIAYADFDRNSACMTKGRGLDSAKIELPLKGCGTKQDPPRVFTNNIVVRFHPSLEMDGDEVITIVCRYPPAIALRPGPDIPAPFESLPPPVPALTGLHILLIICALVFLTFLLVGLGCSYMCLNNRVPRTEIHHQAMSGSEITKFSGSTFSHISMFTGYKIPRALVSQQAYGSEAQLVMEHSDTIPSDYPSESHSEHSAYYAEEYYKVDEERSLPVSSAGSYENKAFVHQQSEQRTSSSLYSENINEIETAAVRAQQRHGRPIEPKFDVHMRVKQAPPPPSPIPSDSEASVALERNLTTILEREETTRTTSDSTYRPITFSYTPEIHAPPNNPSRQQTPPVYSRILRKQAERETITTETAAPQPTATIRTRPVTSPNIDVTEKRSMTEVTDSSRTKYRLAEPPKGKSTFSQVTEEYHEITREEVEPLVEPVVAPRRPEIKTHDDVYSRTITERKTEDIERHRRKITEYPTRPKPDPKWDVTIRNYPGEEMTPPPEWESFSDVSSASNLNFANDLLTKTMDEPIDVHIQPRYTSRTEMLRSKTHNLSEEMDRSSSSWYNLERVFEPQFASELNEEERTRWREILTTENTLKTLLSEAVVKEDYELIKKDSRYTNLFPQEKWDVIIRIISPPSNASSSSSSNGKGGQRYKRSKSSDCDNRSRRSSLPTLYEYDSDGGSSARTFGQEHIKLEEASGSVSKLRKLSSITRGCSEADLRSMSEMTVRDFVKGDGDDLTSLSSFDGESLVRSLSQPSLARSGSEFTEHWGLPSRNLPNWDDEPTSSTETTPRAVRKSETTSTITRTTRLSEKESYIVSQSERQTSNWFHDDSEPEMQI